MSAPLLHYRKTHYSQLNLSQSMTQKATFVVTICNEYKCRSNIAILDRLTRHSICDGDLEAPLFLIEMFVCMYVGLIALLINKLNSQLYENKKKN